VGRTAGDSQVEKISAWSIAIPLILLSIGFILIGAVGYAMSPDWLTAQQIQDQARKATPEPTYPPAPGGKQLVKTETQKVCTRVPRISGLRIDMQDVCSNISIPRTELVGPTNDETNAWQEQTAAMRNAYETSVAQEAARISERQRSDLKSFVKDMIQIGTGILGLITGITALVVGAIRGSTNKEGKESGGGTKRTKPA
jgi:hypothetical protein